MFFDAALVFILTTILSAVGSIQPGVTNVRVILLTVKKQARYAKMLAFGSALSETIQAFFAISLVFLLDKFTNLLDSYGFWFTSATLLIISFYLLRHNFAEDARTEKFDHHFIGEGFLLTILNPQIILFWFVVAVWVGMHFSIMNLWIKIAFSLGAGLGVFILLYLSIFFTQKNYANLPNKIGKVFYKEKVFRFISYFLICLAILNFLYFKYF